MDNQPFTNTIHVFLRDRDNDVDTEDMPELVSLDAPGSHATESQPQTTADVDMNGEDSNMPPLYSLDEDYDNNHDSESDQDAREVEMQTVNHRSLSEHAVPNPARTSHTSSGQPAVNNRRARVEDDEDEDRDRRHPSQRIGNSANASSSAGPSSSAPTLPQTTSPAPPGVRFRGQAPIFNRPVVDEVRTTRAHPFRFFQHLMSNNNNNNFDNNAAGNTNPVPPSDGPMPAPQPHQDGNTPDDQPHGRRPIIEGFSVTLDIGLGPTFRVGEGVQPRERQGAQPEGEPASNIADTHPDGNPDAQNGLPQNLAEFMARFGLIGQALGLGDNGAEQTTEAGANGGNNPNQGAGGVGPTPGAQFGFNFPAGGFNLANLAGLGFGFNLDGSGFAEKEDPQRARLLVDGLEEVPVGLVKRLERVGGTGGGMGEDETKGGDGGCAICWDRLLGSVEENQHEKGENKEEDSERVQLEASEKSNEASKHSASKIVSLPCAHVFHAECLIPWFSRPRQTTCPTCRFNIDPENLTYVSWRRRMRERRERERAEARARGDQENTNGNEPNQGENAPPPPTAAAATMAGDPPGEPIPDVPSFISEHALNFLSSLRDPPLIRSQTPVAAVLNVHRTATPRSQSQPPAVQAEASSSSSSSAIGSSTSQSTTQTHSPHEGGSTDPDIHRRAQEGADDWEGMPGLQDMSDSDDEESNEDDEDEDEDEEEGNETQEQDGRGTQAPPALPHANEPAIAPTQRPRQNVPLAPRTIQTARGLVTLIPVPINFPFPSAGNGIGVGVQAGGNGNHSHLSLELTEVDLLYVVANGNAQGQGQLPNVNANVNNQGEYMRLATRPDTYVPRLFFSLCYILLVPLQRICIFATAFPQGFPHGIALPHSAVQLPHMPEFGSQRGPQGAGPPPPAVPVPAGTTGNDANANSNQTIPVNPFVNAQEAAAITNTEEQLIQHLLLQGVTADEAESFRRSSLTGRQADRLRRGEDPVARPESEDGGNEDLMMDVDEGMSMVVDMTMEQGGIGSGPGAEPTAMTAQDDQDRQEFAQVINFLNIAARQAQAQAQAQAGTETQGQAQAQGTQGVAAANPSAQGDAPQQQQRQEQTQPQQQQGQGFVPFMAGLNAGFNIGNHIGTFAPADGAAMNEFLAQMFANLTGGSPERRRQAQEAQRQNVQPQPQAQAQAQPEAGQEPAEGAIPTNANNGRRRQQAHFAFGNVTIGPFTNLESLFDQIPIFNPNGGANGGAGDGQERVRKAWTLPAAPGPTLRERIERKERDAGLRCYDVSCGVGPSDEDPIVSDETIAAGLRQLMIMNKNHGADGKAEGTCPHTFHPGCLVSAERVALGGAGVNVIESGDVEVSCPVCRSAGCVTKQQWDEGISALA